VSERNRPGSYPPEVAERAVQTAAVTNTSKELLKELLSAGAAQELQGAAQRVVRTCLT